MSQTGVSTEKGLPTNPEAERFVLGSILMDDSTYIQCAGVLEPDDFSLEKHRRIFVRMGDLHTRGERIDRVTLANELLRHGELESCDGIGYLVSLDDGLPQIYNLESYFRIVKDKSVLRKIIFTSQNLIHRAADVHLKERRTLVLVPRETPLHLVQLRNLTICAEAGAVVLPAMPAFYTKPATLDDAVNFIVGRVCDQIGVQQQLFPRWGEALP